MINSIKNNTIKTFFVKLAAFFLVVFLVDLVLGNLLKKFYFKQESGYDYLTTYAIDKTEADILILGSSRAANIFDPEIFENKLNQTCFNAGRFGYPIFYHYAVLKAVLKRHKPKHVILSFDAGSFSINQDAYDRISSLLPYYSDHPQLRSIVELKGPYERIKLLSSIYPYNSSILPIISGNSEAGKRKFANKKGYFPMKEVINDEPLKEFDYTTEKELDSIKIGTYKSLITTCLDSNINLIIVCPPYLIKATGIDHSLIKAKEIAAAYKINFFDYSKDTTYTNNPQLFADYRHLNVRGVELLSRSVSERIVATRIR